MSEEYMDIQVYIGDNEEQYVKFGDLLELIERLKIRKEKQNKEIERLNNIIKEVREYIEIIVKNTPSSTRKDYANMLLIDYKKVLDILDIGEKIK